jgi:arylsulfatase A-like enzyme
MSHRHFVLALAAFALAAPAIATPPNVVIILMDDLGGRDVGCYGSTYYHTPNIDRLATNGVRFSDAYAACPVCSPTRASILTGKYPARLHLTDFLYGRPDRPDQRLLKPNTLRQLPLEEVTLAEALKSAGYTTGHVGKWHLGGPGFLPTDQGFDVNVAGGAAGSPPTYFAPFKNARGQFLTGLENAPAGEYLTDRLTSEAEKFIEMNKDRPFFLYFAHYAVHIPLMAKPEVVAKYSSGGKPGTQNNPIYAAMVESMDDSVGRVMKKLADLELTERTIVIFTSDNGGLSVLEGPNTPATSNLPLREGKGYLYEGGIREPFIISGPGVTKPGTTCKTPVCSIDLFPTVLNLCGVKSDVKVDGINIAPLLRGEKVERPDDALYWHYPHYSNQGGRPCSAIRWGGLKLIKFHETGRMEVYDVETDVGETYNVISNGSNMSIFRKIMSGKLDAWLKSVDAQMNQPNPKYVPNPQAADGIVTLPAKTADVHGLQLRFEPSPHKNTLGCWFRVEDSASWEFEVTKPGTFRVEVLQGCGTGQGGSTVEVTVAGQTNSFVVEDTGHFQNFKSRDIGSVRIDKSGRFTLAIQPKTKAKAAVMDVRQVRLLPVGG